MSMEMIYLLMCVAVTLGAMGATFYFAKKDWAIYAVFSFFIAALAFSSALDAVKMGRSEKVAQHTVPMKDQPTSATP